jgi:hypothetical protein
MRKTPLAASFLLSAFVAWSIHHQPQKFASLATGLNQTELVLDKASPEEVAPKHNPAFKNPVFHPPDLLAVEKLAKAHSEKYHMLAIGVLRAGTDTSSRTDSAMATEMEKILADQYKVRVKVFVQKGYITRTPLFIAFADGKNPWGLMPYEEFISKQDEIIRAAKDPGSVNAHYASWENTP